MAGTSVTPHPDCQSSEGHCVAQIQHLDWIGGWDVDRDGRALLEEPVKRARQTSGGRSTIGSERASGGGEFGCIQRFEQGGSVSTWPGVRRLLRTLPNGRAEKREDVEVFQARCLRRLVSHAYQNVPYYRRLFDRNGIDPRDIRSAGDLGHVPETTKQDLQNCPPGDLVPRGVDPSSLIPLKTTGSSGQPLIVRRSWFEQTLLHGFLLRINRRYGLKVRDHMVGIGVVKRTTRREHKGLGKALRRLGFYRVTRISTALEPRDILSRLTELQPDIVTGYASVLAKIGQMMSDQDRRALRPRFLMSGAEVLTSHRRSRITKGFGAPVYDVYGSVEFHTLAWECAETGEMHTCDDSVIVDVVRKGRSVPPTEQGEVVATALHSYAMPLIRYRLGDVVTRGAACCSCGEPYSTIRGVQGRMAQYIPLPTGRQVHVAELDDKIRGGTETWVTQYQFVQKQRDLIVVQAVPSEHPSADDLKEMKTALKSLVGRGMEIDIRLVDEIRISPGGKFELYISEMEPVPGTED